MSEFSWQGSTYKMSDYDVKDGDATPKAPPKLSRTEFESLTSNQKRSYAAIDRAYQRFQLRRKLAALPGLKNLDPTKAAVTVRTESGRELDNQDFRFMRDGLLAIARSVKQLKDNIDNSLTSDPSLQNNTDLIALRQVVDRQIKASTKFVEGAGGYSGDEFARLVDGFEKIEKMADEINSQLIDNTELNAFFLRHKIDMQYEREERSKYARLLAQMTEQVGISAREIGRQSPDSLSKSTGGVTTTVLTSLLSSLGPIGQVAAMLSNNEWLAEKIEEGGASIWNKATGFFRGKRITKALARSGSGVDAAKEAAAAAGEADGAAEGEALSTPSTATMARDSTPENDVEEESVESVVRRVIDDADDNQIEKLAAELGAGISEGIHDQIDRLISEGHDAAEIANSTLAELDEKLPKVLQEALGEGGAPILNLVGKLVKDELRVAFLQYGPELMAKADSAVSARSTVEKDDAADVAADAADRQETAAKRSEELAKDLQEKGQEFLGKNFEQILELLQGIKQTSGDGNGILSTALGAGGLAALLAKAKGTRAGKWFGNSRVAGGLKAILGKVKNPKAAALLALLAGGTAWAASRDDSEEMGPLGNLGPNFAEPASPPSMLTAEDSPLRVLEENKDAIGIGAGLLSGAGKLAGRVFTPIGAAVTAYDEYQSVKDRTDISSAEKIGSVAGATSLGTAGMIGGAIAGQALIPIPVVGAVAGSVVGGLAGTEAGRTVGKEIGSGYDSARNTVADWLWALSGKEDEVAEALAPVPAKVPTGNFSKGNGRMANLPSAPVASTGPQRRPRRVAIDTSLPPLSRGARSSTKAATHTSRTGIVYTEETQKSEKAADAASASLTGKPPEGAKLKAGGSNVITALGYYLNRLGFKVSGHKAFGGVEPWRDPANPHSFGEAIDINAGPGQSPAEMRALDQLQSHLAPLISSGQILYWWRKPYHYDHAHIQIPQDRRGWGNYDPDALQTMADMGIPVTIPEDATVKNNGAGSGAVIPPGTHAPADFASSTSLPPAPSSSSPMASATALPIPSSLPGGVGSLPSSTPTVNVQVTPPPATVVQAPPVKGAAQPNMADANFGFGDPALNAVGSGVV